MANSTTVYVQFTPNPNQLFTFNIPLTDNLGNVASYVITIPWNSFGGRYYINCTDQSGIHMFTLPLIESPDTYDISLSAGYFSTQIIYRESTQNFEITDQVAA